MRCKICSLSDTQWEEGDLDEHLLATHRDEQPAIRAVYADRYERLFEDGEPVSEPDAAADGATEPAADSAGTGDPGDAPTAPPAESGPGSAPDATPPTDADPPTDASPPTDVESDVDFEDSYGKKWFMIGVGGAGNNILDAVLLRRDTLRRNNENRALIWEGGLAGYGILNTNIAELEQTYYAQEERGYSRQQLMMNAIIGQGAHGYQGMGRRWDHGKQVMERDFEDGRNPFRERWDMDPQTIQDAQAIMFVHSVTKGTGCGSTPVLARKIREEVLNNDYVISKALLSSVVIPSEGGNDGMSGGKARVNGVVGLARMSAAVDAIVPFDNERLEAAGADITPRIDGLQEYNPPHYADLNRPLVAFLEAFTMSSTPQFVKQDASMSIHGDVFDVADSFRPVEDKYPLDLDADHRPAVILAPVLGRARGETINRSQLETLISNALYQNRLAKFDPETAWGGTFLLYGPERKMDEVSRLVSDGVARDILASEDFLDAANQPGTESVDIHVEQLVTPDLDDVYLWGTLWNPRMPSLERMYDHAKNIKEGNSQQAENLREIWEYVEPLFSCLGRENMA
ncbi:cell division protein FtsZ [Halopenitus persicus]|uniref:Tubulin/FtsZ family, GTPase domain n=1 Tax=Halopenitus persicus TaxID=1048396 RepID=A0A1H3MR93_9EURY|nr:cell division protein FtsZ [Halopenitus persicus]SDY79014.1 Tubulin/FtsZ family, GTPase domain [Halopenitus persicus]